MCCLPITRERKGNKIHFFTEITSLFLCFFVLLFVAFFFLFKKNKSMRRRTTAKAIIIITLCLLRGCRPLFVSSVLYVESFRLYQKVKCSLRFFSTNGFLSLLLVVIVCIMPVYENSSSSHFYVLIIFRFDSCSRSFFFIFFYIISFTHTLKD